MFHQRFLLHSSWDYGPANWPYPHFFVHEIIPIVPVKFIFSYWTILDLSFCLLGDGIIEIMGYISLHIFLPLRYNLSNVHLKFGDGIHRNRLPQNFRWVQAQLGHCREALQVRGAKTFLRRGTLRHFFGEPGAEDQENWYGCYLW